jgi:hypothetical protein
VKMLLQVLDIRPGVAQSVRSLTTDWTTGVRTPAEGKDFILVCVQTSSDANLTFYPIGTGGPLPRGKAWSGRPDDVGSTHL